LGEGLKSPTQYTRSSPYYNTVPTYKQDATGGLRRNLFSPNTSSGFINGAVTPRANPKSPSVLAGPGNDDRFIPHRDGDSLELVRSYIISTNKSGLTKENDGARPSRFNADFTGGIDGTIGGERPEIVDDYDQSRPQGTGDNSVQNEYRRRMRGALLNLQSSSLLLSPKDSAIPAPGTPKSSSDSDKNLLESSSMGTHTPTRLFNFSSTTAKKNASQFPSASSSRGGGNDPWGHRQNINPLSFGWGDVTSPTSANSPGKSGGAGRHIPSAPTRILDAPELVDDYYLNLISWGPNNVLAVALGQCVYLWDSESGSIEHLLTLDGADDYVTSVEWDKKYDPSSSSLGRSGSSSSSGSSGAVIAIGTNCSEVQLWDATKLKCTRKFGGHTARVGSLSFRSSNHLSSGSRDSLILNHDLRAPAQAASGSGRSNGLGTFVGHTQEVCGLKWNEDGTTLASGGNENLLCLWDASISSSRHRSTSSGVGIAPRLKLSNHCAAVKALAWCPFHRGLLASGGGTADRTIKFWNTNTGGVLNSIDTGSQVCSLLWSKHQKEICSSHGFSENQLCLWRYPSMTKIKEFSGHTARVLHMDQSPSGGCVVSAAADETLRFWELFGGGGGKKKREGMVGGRGLKTGFGIR